MAPAELESPRCCHRVGTYTWADLPFLSARAAGGSQSLNNGSPGHGDMWRGINAFFPLLLFTTAAQGEVSQGLTHLPASPPQPRGPCTAAGALHHRLPLPGRTEGLVPAVAETDREGRRVVQRSGGCMHGRGSAVRWAATCNPPQSRAGGLVLQSGSSWCRWGAFPACCQPGEVLGRRRCPVPGARGQSIFTFAIRWTSVCSPAETLPRCHGSWARGNCGLNATERGGEGKETAPVRWDPRKVPAQG